MKKRLGQKEPVSKQGRKNGKPGPTLDAFDDLDADLAYGMDYIDTKEAVTEGRQSKETEEQNVTHDIEVLKKGGSNEEPVNAAGNIGVSTAVNIITSQNTQKWTQEEHEKYTVDERAKLLAEYFENIKKRLAEERADAIRNKPPTKSQLRSLMMTYLKQIGIHEEKVLKEPDSTKVEVKQEGNKENTRKRPGKDLRLQQTKNSRMQKTDSDLEEDGTSKYFF
ncbi:hypothetical protein Tco_0992634 [Tanacetum coccineum]|uniref:Uncharacterized protein n=1 Tax=Tanacetum coccineum TaxID=301880 RepID=A0ABQ5F2U2_9ASTR